MRSPKKFFFFNQQNRNAGCLGDREDSCTRFITNDERYLNLVVHDEMCLPVKIMDDFPRIRLFLDNLWDFSGEDMAAFREEVKTTLLHELGHYLGLDEDQVEALRLA